MRRAMTSETSETSETSAASASTTEEAPLCGGPPPSEGGCTRCVCVADVWACECPPAAAQAGFVTIAPVDYTLGRGAAATPMRSSTARIFYSFHPADHPVVGSPLFVFFNGGPAVSTGLLLGTNTAPWTVAGGLLGGEALAANPDSWTALGHLLYIDARGAGFSYSLIGESEVADIDARRAEFSAANYNTYLDAADFVRVILEFMAERPALVDAPVVIVAESYGGIRAGILLDMLLHHGSYADGSRHYRDLALVEAIEDHLALRFPEASSFPPATVAEQFGRQVLIQPSVAGKVQNAAAGALFEAPGSPLYALAAELGLVYKTCAEKGGSCDPYQNGLDFVKAAGRSGYDTRAPTSWLSALFEHIGASFGDPAIMSALLGVEPPQIDGLWAADRGLEGRAPLGPYRVAELGIFPVDPLLPAQLGPLAAWDRYYMVWSYEANVTFRSGTSLSLDVDPGDPHHGETFLSNLRDVDTFVTDAANDLVIYSPSLAPTLAAYPSIVSSVEVEVDAPDGAARPGRLRVVFSADGEARWIRQPRYEAASHSVTLDRPAALREDVSAWLAGE
jgi:hypothetical protein